CAPYSFLPSVRLALNAVANARQQSIRKCPVIVAGKERLDISPPMHSPDATVTDARRDTLYPLLHRRVGRVLPTPAGSGGGYRLPAAFRRVPRRLTRAASRSTLRGLLRRPEMEAPRRTVGAPRANHK